MTKKKDGDGDVGGFEHTEAVVRVFPRECASERARAHIRRRTHGCMATKAGRHFVLPLFV